jgi:hypothetical protein
MRAVLAVPCSRCKPTTIAPGVQHSVVMATSHQTGPVYYLTCPAGHEERVLLGNPKHDNVPNGELLAVGRELLGCHIGVRHKP